MFKKGERVRIVGDLEAVGIRALAAGTEAIISYIIEDSFSGKPRYFLQLTKPIISEKGYYKNLYTANTIPKSGWWVREENLALPLSVTRTPKWSV